MLYRDADNKWVLTPGRALRGFPSEFRQDEIRSNAIWVAIFSAGYALEAFLLYFYLGSPHDIVPLAADFGSILLLLSLGYVGGTLSVAKSAILLYFDREVPGSMHFDEGNVIACNFELLEDLTRRLSVRPLSDFGFADDLGGGKAISWYSPSEILQTLEVLDEHAIATTEKECIGSHAQLAAALSLWEERLRAANACEASVCLILHGNAFSGKEILVRKGRF